MFLFIFQSHGDKFFIYQIIDNSVNGVDVDRWDYIVRDAYYLGMDISFDYKDLLSSIRVINVTRNGTVRKEIGFEDKVVIIYTALSSF